ncbi:HopJ type III effector protein [Zhouia sp. PK063]|uniref:HopJ type III effector protein n=1 Tax=Zhouia sp. PK063 TaxID=3373602 RepID=UPI00378B55F1
MDVPTFLNLLSEQPEQNTFEHTMSVIDGYYSFTPTAFTNGAVVNEANTNNGSCKIFAFAKYHELDEATTLACFGKFYYEDVLQHPEDDGHQNIRNFMKTGWNGIRFETFPLTPKVL